MRCQEMSFWYDSGRCGENESDGSFQSRITALWIERPSRRQIFQVTQSTKNSAYEQGRRDQIEDGPAGFREKAVAVGARAAIVP